MKAGSQFIIASRLLNTFPHLTARLTIVSQLAQLQLYCKGEEVHFIEVGTFPSSFLLMMGAQEANAALQEAKDTTSKIAAISSVFSEDGNKQIFFEGTKKVLSDFFKAEITECKLKIESFKEGVSILNLNQIFYDCAAPFVNQISFEELLPNPQIPFKLAPEYMTRTNRIRISAQEGYLLSRLDQTQTLAEILSMVPGDEQPTRKALATLWAFGVVDSQVLDQLLPKVDVPAPKETAKSKVQSEQGKSARGENISELRTLIEQAYYGLDRQDYYLVLGISTRADIDEIKSAYYGLARKFHPDRFYGVSDAVLKEKVDVIFSSINVAYETLKNAKRRLEYDSSPANERRISTGGLKSENKGSAGISRDTELKTADDYAKKAQKAYDEGNNYQAVQFLKSATQISPETPAYWRQLGIALSRNPQWRKEAEDAFMKAAEIEPKNPENHLYMGFLYKNAGLKLRARKHFASCLQLDPKNEIANRELNAIDTSGPDPETPTSKKGLLGGIFKKK
jgi:curved DNA-binding protein CbpA